jgi:superfamily II DNA or RNA helicase
MADRIKSSNVRETRKKRAGKIRRVAHEPSVSHLRRPLGMDVKVWQTQLRRQFGRAQSFKLKNVGEAAVFSDYEVTNPQNGNRYRVAIRGANPGENFCGCPDFATNDLGTCKHIEFVLGKLEKKRDAKKALAGGFHPPYSEIYLLYAGERQVCFRAGTDCPGSLAKSARKLFDGSPAGAVPVENFRKLAGFLASAQKSGHDLRCYEDALGFIAQARDARERQRIIDQAYPEGPGSPNLKHVVKTDLYPYQAEGALFAARAGRCLIGDEMGLGKTIQAIAATELFARHFGAERVLVICPTSLKHQWRREIAKFTDREALVIGGPRGVRQAQYAEPGFCKITNYDVLSKDLEAINAWSPDVVIVDEAQRVKNWNTIAARALKRIESPYAIVLTGTPLENRLEELLSIVQYVDRHRLGATWRLRHEHQTVDEAGRVIGYRNLQQIGRTLEPIFLRRRKSEVLKQLPSRVDNTVFVAMTDEQQAHHDENGEIVDRIVSRWRKTGYLSDADQRRLTCCLMNMRMSCNSTYLLDHKTDHGTKVDELVTLLDEQFEQPQAKAVVFSQWVGTHELIIRRLKKRGWDYALFHGGVPSDHRAGLVDRFHADPACRVFLSTDAGGVGLNLQHAAATIINMDLPWNPAILEQRIGRVHRLGQSKSVQVVNFVAEGTIEEKMLSILAFKRSLFAGVLDGGESEIFLGGTRLTKFMESVDAVTRRDGTPAAEPAPESEAPQSLSRPSQETDVPVTSEASSGVRTQGAAMSVEENCEGENPWAPLLSAGLKLLETLAPPPPHETASRGGGNGHTHQSSGWVETDATTGRSVLKLPLPEPQVLQQVIVALSRLVAGLGR